MTSTPTTTIAYAAADNRLPVRCADPSGLATATDDFVFDFLTADQYTGGAIPATGATIAQASFANLALDTAPVLGRTAAVTLGQTNLANGNRNQFQGGLACYTGQTLPYQLRKAGVADGAAGNCKSEGFQDFLLDAWLVIRDVGTPGSGAYGVLGRGGGANIDYGIELIGGYLQVGGLGAGALRLMPYAAGQRAHVGFHVAFDAASGTSMVRRFAGGAEVGLPTPFHAIADYRDASAGDLFMVGALAGYDATDVTLMRLRRVFTAWAGASPALDPLMLHRAEHAAGAARGLLG